MAERAVELDEKAARPRIEERGTQPARELARELERARIVAAMAGERAFGAGERNAVARGHAIAAVLAADQ
jgi:hypothetical protein